MRKPAKFNDDGFYFWKFPFRFGLWLTYIEDREFTHYISRKGVSFTFFLFGFYFSWKKGKVIEQH